MVYKQNTNTQNANMEIGLNVKMKEDVAKRSSCDLSVHLWYSLSNLVFFSIVAAAIDSWEKDQVTAKN